jgi:hypothetical protein
MGLDDIALSGPGPGFGAGWERSIQDGTYSAGPSFGWFVEPTYSYSLSKGHEQALGATGGLIIAIY